MFFKSYRELAEDMAVWSTHLPEFSAIVGIPRSGMLPALMLGLLRNIPVFTVEEMEKKLYSSLPLRRERLLPMEPRVILVVDDSVYTGDTMRRIKPLFAKHVCIEWKFGAYMAGSEGRDELDYVMYDTREYPQLMEWSTLHIPFNKYTLVDLDGVIAEDWPHAGEEGIFAERYWKHIREAKCLINPTFPVRAIVTSRLEKWRVPTEDWLREHKIKYQDLIMAPFENEAARAAGDGFGGYKAKVYQGIPEAQLFIESNRQQSEQITFRTEKPVLDWSRKKLLWYGRDTATAMVQKGQVQMNPVDPSAFTNTFNTGGFMG